MQRKNHQFQGSGNTNQVVTETKHRVSPESQVKNKTGKSTPHSSKHSIFFQAHTQTHTHTNTNTMYMDKLHSPSSSRHTQTQCTWISNVLCRYMRCSLCGFKIKSRMILLLLHQRWFYPSARQDMIIPVYSFTKKYFNLKTLVVLAGDNRSGLVLSVCG